MGIKLVVLVLVLGLCYFKNVNCTRRHVTSTTDKTLDIENKLINHSDNQSVKTLQYFGDVYDCVEFLKQPAFSNPLLKNHAYHHYQAQTISKSSSTIDDINKSVDVIELPDGGCPIGTVPIRRVKKEDIIDYKNVKRVSADGDKIHRAVVRTKGDGRWTGSSATMAVYRPKVAFNQYSLGLMCLANGPESIQVGWMVNPIVFSNDTQTYLYIYTISGSSECFDTLCGQFVQTSSKIPLRARLTPISTIGGDIYEWNYLVYKDEINGLWKLAVGNDQTELGFWPREVLKNMDDHATYVEFGGEAKSKAGQSGPELGSGLLPSNNDETTAYMRVSIHDRRSIWTDFDTIDMFDDGNIYRATKFSRHYIEYGGPGPRA